MKRKLNVLMMVVVLVSMLVGCTKTIQDSGMGSADGSNNKKQDGKKYVGIVQIVEHPSLDTIRESIVNRLESNMDVEIRYENAQGDQSNLNTICQSFIGDEVDLIIAIATPSAQAAAAATEEIPIVFSAVTDPKAAQLVENLERPEGNITGTSDAIPVDQVFDLAKVLTPEIKTIGFLYTASEVNSQSVVEQAKQIVGDYGYDYEELTITNTSELQQGAESLVSKVDAIYTPIDNTIASAMPILAEVGREKQIPIYVGADSMVADGGYATVGINYQQLGTQTADMVIQILEGKPISEIPVETLNNFEKVINKTTAELIEAPANLEGAIIVE